MSTSTDPVRNRMAAANPAPHDAEPPGDDLAAAVLLDVIDERSWEMTHDTKTHELRTSSPPPRSRRWAWAFTGGLAIVILTVGLAVIVSSSGDTPDAGNEPSLTTVELPTTSATPPPATPPTQPSTTTVTTRPVSGTAPSGWVRIDAGDMVADRVATGPMGMVALGLDVEGPYSERNTAWFSEDGETWQPLSVPEVWDMPGDVTYGDPGFVIVGEQSGHPVVSFSPDGLNWSTTHINLGADEQVFCPHCGAITAVTYGQGAYVAVGTIVSGTENEATEESHLGVWRSTDGQTWTAIPQDELQPAQVSDVTYGPSGFVAISQEWDPESNQAPIWHSEDGNSWTRVTIFEEEYGLSRITYGDAGYVALQAPAVWHSVDGVSWEMVLEAPGVQDVVFVDGGYVVVGAGAIWHSTDGVTWNRSDDDPDTFTNAGLWAVGHLDGKFIAFGEQPAGGNPAHGWIWISQ